MSLTRTVEDLLRRQMAKDALSADDLQSMLRLLSKWRHTLISNTLITRHGPFVQDGPFKGMRIAGRSTEGCHAPRILGCYEHELHDSIDYLAGGPFKAVINIGCAEGYYAVGLARRMPDAEVFAHDIDEAGQSACRALAEANGVGARVHVGGLFSIGDFAKFEGRPTLAVIDIEGGEMELLDPVAQPSLAAMTVLVECHDGMRRGVSDELERRFRPTHSVKRINHQLAHPRLPDWLQKLGHLDQLLAVWEWRSGPTPWLLMEPIRQTQ